MSYLKVDDRIGLLSIPNSKDPLERQLYILQCLNQDFCPYDHKNDSFKKDLKALRKMGYTISNSRREKKYRLELSDGAEYLFVYDCEKHAIHPYIVAQFDLLFKLSQESKRVRNKAQETIQQSYRVNVINVLLHDERLLLYSSEANFVFPGPLLTRTSYSYECVYKYRYFSIPDNETKLRILTAPLDLPGNIYHAIIKDLTESIPLVHNPYTYKNYDNSELYKLKSFYMPSLFPDGEEKRVPWKFEYKTNSGKISQKNNFTPFALVYSFENEHVYVVGNDSISPKSQKYSSVRADFIYWKTLEISNNYCNYENNYITRETDESVADSKTDNNRKRFNSELMQLLYNEVLAEMFGKNVDPPEKIELKIVYSDERFKELQNLAIQRQKGFETFRNSFHQFCSKQNTASVSDSDKALANNRIQAILKTYDIKNCSSWEDIPLYPQITVNAEQNTIIYTDVIRGLGDFASFIRRYGSSVTVIRGDRLKKQLAYTAGNVKKAYQRILSLENTT